MWEIFAGPGTLSVAFDRAGWIVAPSVDILLCPAFDLLNPLFIAVILGLVLEGIFVLTHLGPPRAPFCSSGVSMGNALAETTIRIARAQSAIKQFLQNEQPEFSSMWCLEECCFWNLFFMERCTACVYGRSPVDETDSATCKLSLCRITGSAL